MSETLYLPGLKQIGAAVDKVTRPVLAVRGFAGNRLVQDWPRIVGAVLAEASAPHRISFPKGKKEGGTLVVEVYDSGLAMEMTYLQPIIIEKIAAYYGYRAIDKIKFLQKPGASYHKKEPKAEPLPEYQPDAAVEVTLNRLLEGVDDPALAASLRSLGSRILSK